MNQIDRMTATYCTPLPEVVLKKKWAGDLDGAVRSIDRLLGEDLPEEMRLRLLMEKERIRRLPTQYSWNREQALKELKQLLPALTEEDFDELESLGRVDFIYVRGEKRYFKRFHRSLARAADMRRKNGETVSPENPRLDGIIARLRQEGSLSVRHTLEASVQVDREAFVPGDYLVHLPFPLPSAQQSEIELLAAEGAQVNPPEVPSRSVWWRESVPAWKRWLARYRYVSTIRYADPLHQPAPGRPLYPEASPLSPEDLAEDDACLRFTPALRRLAAEVTAGASQPVEKAWAIYYYITTRVKYSFMRDYFQIDDPGQFCAVNGLGDCGLQALLFILLCRISGIPARWQSGLELDETEGGCHDWAQFYLDGWGWLFADPSFGGSAWSCGSQSRHEFYFGNIDPMRMAASRVFQAPLTPDRIQLRHDPFDHQTGEIEREGAPLPFTARELDSEVRVLQSEVLSST